MGVNESACIRCGDRREAIYENVMKSVSVAKQVAQGPYQR